MVAPEIEDFDHVVLTARDLGATIEFYGRARRPRLRRRRPRRGTGPLARRPALRPRRARGVGTRHRGAWIEAIDGSDGELEQRAAPGALRELLYGDAAETTSVVVRGATVRQIEIAALDVATEPPTMTIAVELRAVRYTEDRATTAFLAGNPATPETFTERWILAPETGDEGVWRLIGRAVHGATA